MLAFDELPRRLHLPVLPPFSLRFRIKHWWNPKTALNSRSSALWAREMKRGRQPRQPQSAGSNRNMITCSDDHGAIHRKAYDTHAPLLWESGPPPTKFAHMPLPKSSRARLNPSICFISKLRIGFPTLIEPAYSVQWLFLLLSRGVASS